MQYWKSQEYRLRNLFRKYGWESIRIPCSGSSESEKGDVVAVKNNLKFRIDHKSTRAKNMISLKREDLEKIKAQSKRGEIPALSISYFGGNEIYIVLSLKDLLKILEV